MAKLIPTPEIDKMHAVKDRSQAIGEFIEWIRSEKEYEIAFYPEGSDTLWPVNTSIEKLLAEHFEIASWYRYLSKEEKQWHPVEMEERRAA